jgi:hypothetical protein
MRNKKGQVATFGEITLIFVAIIFGLAMLGQVFATQNLVTEKQEISNQSIDTTGAYIDGVNTSETIEFTIYSQNAWKQEECPLTSVVVRNSTGTVLTLITDYVLDADEGTFTLVNTASNLESNTTYADYSYCADGYNLDSSSRGIARLWGIFGALIILSAGVFGIRRWIN